MSNVEAGRPATADTIYSICSISKVFTAIAAMQLRDEGVLQLSDHVAAHLPWFATYEDAQPEGHPPITVEMLLTHSAGLPREAADQAYWSPPDFKFPSPEVHVYIHVEIHRPCSSTHRALLGTGTHSKCS